MGKTTKKGQNKDNVLTEAYDALYQAVKSKGDPEAAKDVKRSRDDWHALKLLLEKEKPSINEVVKQWKNVENSNSRTFNNLLALINAADESGSKNSRPTTSRTPKPEILQQKVASPSSSDSTSSDSDSDSDSDSGSSSSSSSSSAAEEKEKAKPSVKDTLSTKDVKGKDVPKPIAKSDAKSSSSSSSSDSDSNSDSSKSSDSDSDSDSSSDSDEPKTKAKIEKKAEVPKATPSSSSESSSSSDSDSSSDSVADVGADANVDSESADSSSESDSDSSSSSSEEAPPAKKRKTSEGGTAVSVPKPSVLKAEKSEKEKMNKSDFVKEGTPTTIDTDTSTPPVTSTPIVDANGKKSKQGRKTNTPFQRIKAVEVQFADERLKDNSFAARGGKTGDYGERASADLSVTRGAGFRKEKNKKKRGSYRGGDITMESHSIKFD